MRDAVSGAVGVAMVAAVAGVAIGVGIAVELVAGELVGLTVGLVVWVALMGVVVNEGKVEWEITINWEKVFQVLLGACILTAMVIAASRC